ncbi:hypothetical protein QBC33DRAFT_215639 [Phialemonium atrogriseum]|uniref:Uncharacterized protein n=1 Tax=Phialemonium atrogriseum TaxID=1093897 RepID=A0AAJ0C6B3_9PEZI|nr:uncharacterized protein QBC33DRAFT_215639 [Phialemonium atrogriseum]KAK1770761.1 hypothetical protein QBC33DRAFT_215639 [Phialemonium atrogriseum]
MWKLHHQSARPLLPKTPPWFRLCLHRMLGGALHNVQGQRIQTVSILRTRTCVVEIRMWAVGVGNGNGKAREDQAVEGGWGDASHGLSKTGGQENPGNALFDLISRVLDVYELLSFIFFFSLAACLLLVLESVCIFYLLHMVFFFFFLALAIEYLYLQGDTQNGGLLLLNQNPLPGLFQTGLLLPAFRRLPD